jgi:hypothetical protein
MFVISYDVTTYLITYFVYIVGVSMPLWQSLSQELFTRWRWVAVSCCISLLWSYNRNIEKECFCYMWNRVGHASLCSSFIVFAVLIFYFLWLSISRRLDDFLFSKLAFMETVGDSASLFKFIFSCKFHVMLAYFWLIDNFWRIGVTTIRLCLRQLQILVYWVTRGIDLELSQ